MLKVVLLCLLVATVSARNCTKVNGVERACDLRLSQFTLAGSHNSGCGAFGDMYHWSGVKAPACWYENQDKSIKAQLEMGIRYFDFDVSYVSSSVATSWWQAGIIIKNDKGYSRSLKKALNAISVFMTANPDEVIVIRVSEPELEQQANVKHAMKETFAFLEFMMNDDRDPLLEHVIKENKRLFLFVGSGIYTPDPLHHELHTVESMKVGGTIKCYSIDEVTDSLESHVSLADTAWQVQVNWYFTKGLCIRDLAHLCNDEELLKLVEINQWVLKTADRPVNFVLVDYVGSGDVRLPAVVHEMNERNIKHFFGQD